jgi:hypothetical protein
MRYQKDMNSAVMREEKVSYFAGSAAVSTWQFIVPMRSF